MSCPAYAYSPSSRSRGISLNRKRTYAANRITNATSSQGTQRLQIDGEVRVTVSCVEKYAEPGSSGASEENELRPGEVWPLEASNCIEFRVYQTARKILLRMQIEVI